MKIIILPVKENILIRPNNEWSILQVAVWLSFVLDVISDRTSFDLLPLFIMCRYLEAKGEKENSLMKVIMGGACKTDGSFKTMKINICTIRYLDMAYNNNLLCNYN